MPPVRMAERNMESAPSKNPKDGPKTLAERINTNHIGSIPTAPVPIGRRAAISAVSTAKSAIDLLSNSLLLTLTMRSSSAKGVANRNIHWGWPCFSLITNGQRKARALIALVRMSAASEAPLNAKIPEVFMPRPQLHELHRQQSTKVWET